MKKYLLVSLLFVIILSVSACSSKEKLYVLSVGDYINDELLVRFEEENNCDVIYTEVSSNEEIYQKLKNDKYDVVVPSDYMINRMQKEGLVIELDFTKLSNYDYADYFDEAKQLMSTECAEYKNYFIPYFWGTVGILYNTDVAGLKEYVETNGLGAIFTDNSYKKGMYDSSRDALCMSLLYNGYDINSFNLDELDVAKNTLINAKYKNYGDDILKENVHNGSLDMAMVYSGDYLDELYTIGENEEDENIAYYVPNITNIWIDGMCITANSENEGLAYNFLNFFADSTNCAENADYIGYAPLSKTAYNALYTEYSYDYEEEMFFPYPEGTTRYMYKYVSDEHYDKLNDLLDLAKNK